MFNRVMFDSLVIGGDMPVMILILSLIGVLRVMLRIGKI